MIKFRHAVLIAGAALIATPVLAQDAAPAAPQAAAPAPATAAVTDAEIKQFAKAALAADKVSKDAAIPAADKQKQMASAVESSGLAPVRFNEIAQAAQADAALQQRVQAAVVAEQQAVAK